MNQYKVQIKDSILQTNLNELVHNIVREMAMAARKVAIYGTGHPSSVKAIEKPFLAFERIFKFKKYVNINLQQGYLYMLNIRLKDSVFNQEIIKYMQIADVSAMLFEQMLSMNDFGKFIDRFVKRVDLSDQSNLISTYLKENRIETININTEFAFMLFEEHKQYRGDVSYDSSVKNVVLNLLPDDLEKLADICRHDSMYAVEKGYDYDFDLIQYLIPEKIASISSEIMKRKVIEHLNHLKDVSDEMRGDLLEVGRTIYKLVMFHPESRLIIEKFESVSAITEESKEAMKEYQSPTGKIKLESSMWIDELLSKFLENDSDNFENNDFVNAFSRLLKTGQKEKAIEIVNQLINYLSSQNANFRQRSLDLLLGVNKKLSFLTDFTVIESMIDAIIQKVLSKEETFEYSEFIWQLFEHCLKEKQFELLSKLTAEINRRRRVSQNITIYDSMTVKKIIESFNQEKVLKRLINELLLANHKTAGFIKNVLVSIGSDEVAIALAEIISHPKRHVRQQAIKILAELGRSSLKVFSAILSDERMFSREEDRHELPDEKWYVIRNSIFVLGLLNIKNAASPLKQRINDPDIRVRREIISALEKIGGEDACDVLLMMSEDSDKEIKESAIIKFGLIGTPEMAPVLIDIIKKNNLLAIFAVHSLGKLGGGAAREFLTGLINDNVKFNEISSGGISKDDLKLAIVKALGQIGDEQSIKSIQEFKENLPTAQKIFFKNSPLNKTIEDILSRH